MADAATAGSTNYVEAGAPMDENEQDYWGTISQIDGAVGRVRSLLRRYGVAEHTYVSITADNGPEVNPAGGQGTTKSEAAAQSSSSCAAG